MPNKCLVGFVLVLICTSLCLPAAFARTQSEENAAFMAAEGGRGKFVANEVLVKFKDGLEKSFQAEQLKHGFVTISGTHAESFALRLPENAREALNAIQGRIARVHPGLGLTKVQIANSVSVRHAIETLYRSGEVEYAEPNCVIEAQAIPNDPDFPKQWALHNTGQTQGSADADIDAVEAWSIRTNAAQTLVAVIDTGVDYNHPELNARMWVNPTEKPNNNQDDDSNDWVDDYYGINVAAGEEGNPMDDNGHGTALAGIIGAAGNNRDGIAGVGWNSRLMALKFMNSAGTGTAEGAITCINYALAKKSELGYRRMVLCFGWRNTAYSQGLRDAIRIAMDLGVLVVAAAGNDDEDDDIFPVYPASYDLENIISVGASDKFDLKATFGSYASPGSNYGMSSVDLFAPGTEVYSTAITSSGYSNNEGTSMSAAYTAGACALLWSRYPTSGWKTIKGLVLNGVEDGLLKDFSPICMTQGRLNLRKSFQASLLKTPAIFSLTPAKADAGDTVIVRGINFGTTPATITFFGKTLPAGNILSWTRGKIEFTVPSIFPKGIGMLQVTTSSGTSRGASFARISEERIVGHLILARGYAASAQVGNSVWVFGGRTYWGQIGHVEKYEMDKNHSIIDSNWMMPIPVSHAGAAAIGRKVFVVGGYTNEDKKIYSTLQIFDTGTQQWKIGRSLPKPIMAPAVISFKGKIYVFGGFESSDYLSSGADSAYVYDPVSNKWNAAAPMPVPTAYAAATHYGTERIWVMGGFSRSQFGYEQRVVQQYEPATKKWRIMPHLIRPHAGAAGVGYGTKVFCLHGTEGNLYGRYDKYADGEFYKPSVGYWMPSILLLPYLPRPLGSYTPSAGQYLSRIFLLGGVTGTAYNPYLWDYTNNVWAFTRP